MSLGPGGWQAILVTVTVPQSYDACELTNTAKITWAPGGSPQNTDAGDDESSATAPINSPLCLGSRSEPIVPGPPEPTPCPQGWSRTPIPGKCCPPRTTWDGKRCKRSVEPPKEECPANSDSAYKYPDCRCEPGNVGTPPNCKPIVPDCKKDEKRVAGKCVRVPVPLAKCPKGQVGTPPNCKPIIVPPKECPKGFVGTPPNCKRIIVPPKECPKGFVGTPPNCKLVIVPPKTCPKGTTGTYPNCKPVGAQVIKKL